MASFQRNYIIKPDVDSFPDLSYTALNNIQAKDIKNGMWCIDTKSGFSGQVQNYRQIKSGKHGHTKCVYQLRFPHNQKIAKESCSAKTIIQQANVKKVSYQFSHIDTESVGLKELNAVRCRCNLIVYGYVHQNKNNKMDIPKGIISEIYKYYFIKPVQHSLVCLDNDFNEIWFPISNEKHHKKLLDKISQSQNADDSNLIKMYDVIILECPKINKKSVQMVQIVDNIDKYFAEEVD